MSIARVVLLVVVICSGCGDGGGGGGITTSPETYAACVESFEQTLRNPMVTEGASEQEIAETLEDGRRDCEDGVIGNGDYRHQ